MPRITQTAISACGLLTRAVRLNLSKSILFGGTKKLLPNVVRWLVKHSVDSRFVFGPTCEKEKKRIIQEWPSKKVFANNVLFFIRLVLNAALLF